jgi:hypothetical protein
MYICTLDSVLAYIHTTNKHIFFAEHGSKVGKAYYSIVIVLQVIDCISDLPH